MDDCLMERLSKELKSHSDFAISTNHNKEFTIIHYTGPVKYNIRNMISKNTDKVSIFSNIVEQSLTLIFFIGARGAYRFFKNQV